MATETSVRNRIERVPWEPFLDGFSWRQGEHLTLLGPTGCGKTTLALRLMELQPYVVVFATKPKDVTFDYLRKNGYRRIEEWPAGPLDRRVLLWPDSRKITAVAEQRKVFMAALADIYERGAWCVYFDEIGEFVDDLRLPNILRTFWRQGRSNSISVAGGSQRPSHIPLYAYSQATHLFLWRTNDKRDVKRLLEIGGFVDVRTVMLEVQRLDHHEVLYVDTRRGGMAVTQVEL